jgi:hypothetical protein
MSNPSNTKKKKKKAPRMLGPENTPGKVPSHLNLENASY